jgi:predicted AlkP superfamily pyrophosphatase or phosphodiesterase
MRLGRPPGTTFCFSCRTRTGLAAACTALSILLVGCGSASSPTAVPTPPVAIATPPPSPKVALISIDGLRADALAIAQAPEIHELMARGVYTLRGRTVLPAVTLPAHTSMLTGLDPSVHKILWDDYKPEKGTITAPTIFAIAKAAGKRTVAVVGKEKFRTLASPGTIDSFVFVARGDAEVANQAIIEAGVGFDLLFVHLPDVDLTGHAESWMSPAYMAAVEAADTAVGRLVAALPRNTTVIVTADHGGKGKTHGTDIPEDLTVPWVIAGGKVPAHGEMSRKLNEVDSAATALWVLGLKLPDGCAAQVVQDAFTQP